MNPESILAKSAKGLEEIETRAHHLSAKLRQLLVRVDGAKSVEQLVSEAGDLAPALLGQLEVLAREGFVIDTVAPEAAPDAIEVAEAAVPAPAPAPEMQFNSPVKFKLKDLLVDAIGIDTGRMGLALDQCRSREELARWVELALPFILQIAGKDKANVFRKSARQLLGG